MANTPQKYTALLHHINADGPGSWRDRHIDAMINPKPGFERAIVRSLRGWLEYAEEHETRYESKIGDDYVLGNHWEAIGDALRGLLNGECGRLDCGTLDSILLQAMKSAGIETENK